MSRELFGTDGVRGRAGEYPLDSSGVDRIARAVGTHFAEVGEQIVIGCDTRVSSEKIVADLTKGLTAVGVNAVSAGVIPTPGLAYLTREQESFVAGIMVTASHNTYEYNGIKVFDKNGDKLSDEVEAILNGLIETSIEDRAAGTPRSDTTLVEQYEDFLVASRPELSLNNLTIAIDSANGAASGIAERVFRRFGADVTPLFDTPNGTNINDRCGATDTHQLAEVVTEKKLALGIALDGDADRLILIDNLGREVKGDYVLYILAVANNFEGVVATVMSNLGFEKALTEKHIQLVRTAVGDRYVLEGLAQTGYKLGGEQSGHIILPDILATGDGMLAAIQVLAAVSDSDKTLAEWCDEVTILPQALVNIALSDRSLLERPDIQDFVHAQEEKFSGRGRLLIRPSGTEPLARVMVEADNADELATQIAKELEILLSEKRTSND
jgi:phosphoglucosamine mutase